MSENRSPRRFPIGAEVVSGGVSFRVWAPRAKTVSVSLEEGPGAKQMTPLQREEGGYFSALIACAAAGTRYRFQLDSAACFPDPASRFQPSGPHGPSQVVDPSTFPWTDHDWPGVKLRGQVFYEMHVGTFTPEGTWAAAARRFPHLKNLGVTVIEMMPVADFAGNYGWGYDGVNLYAPTRLYGQPDDLRRFVNEAHAHGLGVILDVVYNHFGPEGNYIGQYAEDFFSKRYENEWGDALNFDGQNSAGVREFFRTNAEYWINEFHFDGLRLDATQQIFDSSPEYIVAEITRAARAAAGGRDIIIVAEDETQRSSLARCPEQGGCGLDGIWNDDFHHSTFVALTGRKEAYYSDYRGSPQEILSSLRHGFLFQGQRSGWQGKNRGTPALDLEPWRFVNFIQNHDQVANSLRGDRLHQLTDLGRYRAVSALLLLAPATPLLFQGQEYCSSSPFVFFADFSGPLRDAVCRGRSEFLSQFQSIQSSDMRREIPNPCDPATVQRCKLDFGELERNRGIYEMYRELLRMRREDPTFRLQGGLGFDGAVLGPESFLLRFFGEDGDDRVLLVNFGLELSLEVLPEPLLAPPPGREWKLIWSSEEPRFGGEGADMDHRPGEWRLAGHCAVVLAARQGERRNG